MDKQLPAEAQQACEGPDEGITLAELHSALKASARGKKPVAHGHGQKSGIGQLAACPSWAGCMWQSRCWQPPCGTMPLSSSLLSSDFSGSAGQLTRYVASAQHHSQGDAAVALAQGNSQDSAALPAPTPSAALFPRVLTSSLLPAQGGVWLVEVPT
ncbi:hypothetical protein ABBQ38_008989 [Trebouxia sp. C0009 RCD-2024]